MVDKNIYCGHETPAELALEGLPLASFRQRALGQIIDLAIFPLAQLLVIVPILVFGDAKLHDIHFQIVGAQEDERAFLALVAYHSLCNYFANGRTLGKWIMGIRVVSLVGPRLGRWQSVERALGYGAAMLEGGLGFAQYFWSPNRMCAQDRLAETIVVRLRGQ